MPRPKGPEPEAKPKRDMSKAHAAKKAAAAARQLGPSQEVERLIADPATPDELRRKLSYVQAELKRRQGDQALIDRRRELLAEAARRF